MVFTYKICEGKLTFYTRKKIGTDASPSSRTVAFTRGDLCDYTFGHAAFPLCMSGPSSRECSCIASSGICKRRRKYNILVFYDLHESAYWNYVFCLYIYKYFLVHYDLFTNSLTSMLRFQIISNNFKKLNKFFKRYVIINEDCRIINQSNYPLKKNIFKYDSRYRMT